MSTPPHVPVLLDEVVAALDPQDGETFVDGTFGAGGYTQAILDAADCRVVALDRDPTALEAAGAWAEGEPRLHLVRTTFSSLDAAAEGPVDGVTLDIGVSSMQLDRGERGFSFLRDGPLDMRMGDGEPSAATIVNEARETELADIFFQYGEERRARALARAVVAARAESLIETTARLAGVIEAASPPRRAGAAHPATRAFQALRIAVNDELGELARGLAAAERALRPGGRLAIVTFHSLEDRIVKRFLNRASGGGGASRHAPEPTRDAPTFEAVAKPVAPSPEEVARNPRARSARLRAARRTAAPARAFDPRGLGLPGLALRGLAA